jgi:hypothetical protein
MKRRASFLFTPDSHVQDYQQRNTADSSMRRRSDGTIYFTDPEGIL